MTKLPKGWSYLVVGDKLYILDEDNDKIYFVTEERMIEVNV